MSKINLPTNFAPGTTNIPEPALSRLNAALYRAQARAAEVEVCRARFALADREARIAAQDLLSHRFRLSQELGIANLGVTHGWNEESGEVYLHPVEAPKG